MSVSFSDIDLSQQSLGQGMTGSVIKVNKSTNLLQFTTYLSSLSDLIYHNTQYAALTINF